MAETAGRPSESQEQQEGGIAAGRDPLVSQFARIPPPWRALLALGPVLSMILLALFPYQFPEAPVRDAVVIWRGARPDLTTGTMRLAGEWEPAPGGFAPRSGDAFLAMEAPGGPWRQARIFLHGRGSQEWTLTLRRGFDRTTVFGVVAGEWVELHELPGPSISRDPLEIRLSPRGEPVEGAALTRAELVASPLEPGDRPPAAPGAIVGGFLPLAAALFLARAGRRTATQALYLGGIGAALLLGAALAKPDLWAFVWAATAAFFLGGSVGSLLRFVRLRQEAGPASTETQEGLDLRAIAEACAIAALLCFAAWVRWEYWLLHRNLPLLPDARGYLEIARVGSFYETLQGHAPWIREPLFPALIRWWIGVMPDTMPSARFGALVAGLLPVLLSWLAGRRLFGPVVALGAAAWLAFGGYAAGTSVALLRDDLLAALFLGLLAVVIYLGEKRWWRAAAFGIIAAALALTRVNLLFLGPVILALEAWRRGWKPAEVALALVLLVVPSVPHLMFNAQVSGGDWLYSSNVHTRYYLNKMMIGEPGYPATLGQWNQDPYVGDVVGNSALLKELGPAGSFLQLVHGGFEILAVYPLKRFFAGWDVLLVPGILGAWVLWRRRRELWWMLLWFALFLGPLALIAPIGLDHRLALPAAPLILWVWGAGVLLAGEKVWDWGRRLARKQRWFGGDF